MKKMFIYSVLCYVLLLFTSSAHAAHCHATSGSANFGTLNSFLIQSQPQITSGTTGFFCTGSLASILGTNTVSGNIVSTNNQSGSTPRLYNSTTGSYVPYSLCKTSACTTTYQVGDTITWSSTTLLGLLGLFNSTDGSLPIYVRTTAGANVPAGTYTDTINMHWTWTLCDVGVLGACLYDTGSADSTITVTLVVSNYCYIDSAPDIDFGSAALPNAFTSINSSMQTRCTQGATYTVKLTSANGEVNNLRRMSANINSTSYYLLYQLYRSNVAWTQTNDYSSTGTGFAQTINYTATIDASQANQPAGQYNDTVTVTLTY
ncbi:spore coat protein U domain-containing protein [Acinetobacter sp. ME22]|uniref:Csu type fimbrial protein n=1 Tax=Acinetobacter sp. ME22 TaxID=2904802 RepID=UPI001EDB209F|nr:spore coat protein U domain-containing protein [Acinetobacter sp. ME22]MCG2574449.1 spore coat protein U domain-containing protein [Acinetobacter sp. ME22]